MNKAAVILLSGGLDSTTCAAIANKAQYELHGITINYGPVSYTHLTLPTTPYV